MHDSSKSQVNITSQWSKCMNILDKFGEAFNTFKTSRSAESSLFAYWNNFLSNMAPVMRDLTRSFWDADWYLHLSSICGAVDFCFSFDRINYKCWLRIYYEDFLALPKRFAKMHQSFLNGDFVVSHSSRKRSAFQWIRLWKELTTNQKYHLLLLLPLPEERRSFTSGI